MSERRWDWVQVLCLAWIVAAPLVQAFRGVDLTDTGFLLANQYWMFRDPSAVSYWFHLWLPNLLGGLVLEAAAPVGLFASKLAAAILFWGLVWAVFRLYRHDVPRRWLWLGVAATLTFDFADKINIVHYNNLSALLYAWGVVLLVEAATSRRRIVWALAGAFLAANAFARLPNILGLGLIIVPYLVAWLSRDRASWRLGWFPFAAFFAGAMAAAIAFAGLIALLGHGNLYLDSLRALSNESTDSGSHYGLRQVIGRPLRATFMALAQGASVGGLLAACGFVLAKIRRRSIRLALGTAVGAALAVAATLLVRDLRVVAGAVAGLVYLSAVLGLFWRAPSVSFRLPLAAALSAATVFLLNWGSDTGIAVSTYVLPLAVPALLLTLGVLPWNGARPARLVLVVALLGYGAGALATKVYRDDYRGSALVPVEGVGPTLTTPQRAAAIEALVADVRKRSKPGNEVLIADSLPLIHYLTQTKPYLGNPWPGVMTDRGLEDELKTREKTTLPVLVVIAKANARKGSWPSGPQVPPVGSASLLAFLERNGFVWDGTSPNADYYVPAHKEKTK